MALTLPYLANLDTKKTSTSTLNSGTTKTTAPAPVKIPYNNGFYSGPYDAAKPVIDSGGASVPTPVGDGGAAARAAAQSAADAAATAARVSGLRGDITSTINNIKGTYDSIYGTAQNTANEQNQTLLSNYGKSVNDVNTQANTGEQQTGAAYSARGAYDSSYNGNAVQTIKDSANSQIQSLGDELNTNQASLGQFVSQKQAEATAQKSGLDSILSQISESTDPSELASLRNTLTSRLADLQASSADIQSNKTYLSQLSNVTPIAQRTAALQSVIGNIVNGSASASLKKSIGTSFIQNSGLDDDSKNQLIAQLTSTVDSQKQ